MMIKNEIVEQTLKNALELASQQGWKREDVEKFLNETFNEKPKELSKEYIAEGIHGTCSWSINKNGILSIFPTNGFKGMLANQSEFRGTSPWREHSNDIKRVSVHHGVAANKDANGLFAGLDKCNVMDVDKLDTTRTEKMSSMFAGCKNVIGMLNVNNFDTKNVIDTSTMFKDCGKLVSIYMQNADTGRVLNAMGMFEGCGNLENLYADKADFKDIPKRSFILAGCDKLKDLNLVRELGGTKSIEMPDFLKGWTPPKPKAPVQSKNRYEMDR